MSTECDYDDYLDGDDQEQACWSDLSRAADDLRKLARVIRSAFPTLPLTCTCANGSCDRCELERILGENGQVDRISPLAQPTPPILGEPVPF